MVEHQPSKLDTWFDSHHPLLLPKNSRDGILCMEPVNTVDWRVKDQCVYLCIADCNGCPVSADIEERLTVRSVIGAVQILTGLVISQKRSKASDMK